jgi:cytochrome c553
MKTLILGLVLLISLSGCTDKPAATTKAVTADVGAGKLIAERDCKACHGLDGKGVAPAIPNLAAQREGYLVASLKEYKEGKRGHSALQNMTAQMSEADMRNIAAYYASQAPVVIAVAADVKHSSPYEQGKKLAEKCASCHAEDGNSKTPGTPTLAGQQPHYLVAAIEEYHQGERAAPAMKSMLRDASKLELESLGLYFAAQSPVQRGAPTRGDAAAGEPATAMCGGCHGAHGVSADGATPSLAGQDFSYLVKSIKSYRTTRKNWGMQRYVAGLGEQDIDNVAAYYATQTPKAADKIPGSTQELAEKCNRCHDQSDNPAIVAPKMRGQDRDYLVMALRAYRDGKRDSETMHKMSFPYSNAIIESLASWYASQPAK